MSAHIKNLHCRKLYFRVYRLMVKVGDTPVSGGKQVVSANTVCYVMPDVTTTWDHHKPYTDCVGGPIYGRYVIFTHPFLQSGNAWEVAEVTVNVIMLQQ